MNNVVYLDTDIYGRKYVREIIPIECRPVAEWYNEEFASQCVEAPENVQQNMIYDQENKTFSEWYLPENPGEYMKTESERLKDLEDILSILLS